MFGFEYCSLNSSDSLRLFCLFLISHENSYKKVLYISSIVLQIVASWIWICFSLGKQHGEAWVIDPSMHHSLNLKGHFPE